MKPSKLLNTVKLMYKAKHPLMVWGPPGVGKSQILAQATSELGIGFIDIRLVIRDEVDMRGVPFVDKDGKTKWATPAEFPTTGKGIVLLDEINAARPSVQAVALQLTLDRKIGEYTLPPGWSVMAAGNRASDKTVTYEMPTALRDRFLHVELETDFDDWCAWAVRNDIDPMVLAFIRFRPALLHTFDTEKSNRSFATPRSWERVSDLFKLGPDKEIERELYAGKVGEPAAIELMAFIKQYRDLPDIDTILAKPKSTMVPTQPAAQYAVATALARRATKENLQAIITYTSRPEMPVEYQIMLMRDIGLREPQIFKQQVFLDWAVKNRHFQF